MRYTVTAGKPEELRADCLILLVPQFSAITDPTLKQLDRASRGAVRHMLETEEFKGKSGELVSVVQPEGYAAPRVVLVGLGESRQITPDSFRTAMGIASRYKGVTASRKAVVHFGRIRDDRFFQAAAEGYLLGSFKILDFKTGDSAKDSNRLTEIVFAVPRRALVGRLQKAVTRGQTIAEGQLLVRQLASLPGNHLTPVLYAQKIRDLARKHGISCSVLDETAIAKERMGCLLAVSRGSAEPPRFVILKYKGRRDRRKPIVLVGKGVTFDAGGISLKPAQDMHEMKGDMTGSAVMFSVLLTASRLKLPLNLVALLPLTENLPSGTAIKPGDVITSRKGLTIEIINTDAEGRLILADALDYANTFEPQAVIDIATLTGAALYVLGYSGAPIIGNNPRLMDQIKRASTASAERVWEMPLWDDFRELMKSSFADLVNSGGKPAGTLTASAFLENFIGDWPWAHIDIAYVDVEHKGKPYIPRGATGIGLRLLIELLLQWKKV